MLFVARPFLKASRKTAITRPAALDVPLGALKVQRGDRVVLAPSELRGATGGAHDVGSGGGYSLGGVRLLKDQLINTVASWEDAGATTFGPKDMVIYKQR